MATSLIYLSNIKIVNWRSISEAEINFFDNGSPRKRTIFLGENGAGKTSILRAIALSTVPVIEASALIAELSGHQRRKSKKGTISKTSYIEASFTDKLGKERYCVITRVCVGEDGKEFIERETTPAEFPWDRIFSAGYGVGRGVRGAAEISEYDRRLSVLSLFKDGAPLFDAESVLKSVALETKNLETKEKSHSDRSFPSLHFFLKTIRNLFRLAPSYKIDITGKGVLVHGPWGSQPFHALGDGYRSTAGWVLDFLGRAWSAEAINNSKPAGIVLVDEVDEHLHPSWAQEIMPLLSRNFPEVQFIFTTHSPVPIANTASNELVLISQSNTISEIHQDLPDSTAKTIDTLLKGKWFGLEKTMDNETEELVSVYKDTLAIGDFDQIERARTKLQLRAPSLSPSIVEEMAMKSVAFLRAEMTTGNTEVDAEVLKFSALLNDKIKGSSRFTGECGLDLQEEVG